MSRSIIVLQARMSSSRLPAKVLLPVCGVPVVVLAAKRAMNTGRDLIVATSDDMSDDYLAKVIEESGLKCFRGSLNNVLKRFVDALAAYEDDSIVIRLTADNVFPDGALLDAMETEFVANNREILVCGGEASGLPYGVSAEITRLKYLRDALQCTDSPYDHEHVTTYTKRQFTTHFFKMYQSLNKSHFRCTIDSFEDYISVQTCFKGVKIPTSTLLLDLVEALSFAPYQPFTAMPANKLVLGTAQLGLNYGIANITGKPSATLAQDIIKTAIANNVNIIDTAHAYGESETVIGNALKLGWASRSTVFTKLSTLSHCPHDAPPAVVQAFVDASIYQSCAALQMERLDGVLLHRASHLLAFNGAVWQRLLTFKNKGVIGTLGISIQTPEELQLALDIPEAEHIQLPYNILDGRWDSLITDINKTKRIKNLTIHVRSALLQGLLTSIDLKHWECANVSVYDAKPIMDWLEQKKQLINVSSATELCLHYVRSLPWVDGVVVGVENIMQLKENIRIFSQPILSSPQIESIILDRPTLSDTTLNPALWKS